MRASTLLLALPALAAAQQQVPLMDQLKGWFNKATSSISNAPSSLSVPNPIASGAAKVAELKVSRLTVDNYKTVLQPGAATASPGIEEWMVFVTGGNKTCYGLCKRAEQAWNESAALIAAGSSHPPNLAVLDCETDGVLCNAWAMIPPQVLHMQLPQPLADQSTPASTVRAIPLNRTAVTPPQLAALHLQEKYKDVEPYDSIWQPIDGLLAKNNLALPIGYVIWAASLIPSWAFMIIVSFVSRNLMSRRVNQRTGGAPAPAQGGAGAPPAT